MSLFKLTLNRCTDDLNGEIRQIILIQKKKKEAENVLVTVLFIILKEERENCFHIAVSRGPGS